MTATFQMSALPDDWREFTKECLTSWNAAAFSIRRQLGGKSGAVVFLVEIKTEKHDGLAILKLSSEDPLDKEKSNQESARSISTLLSRRIPEIAHTYTAAERSALLMTVAGHGLLETEMLANAATPTLRLAVQKVSNSLLGEWNPAPPFTSGTSQADALEHFEVALNREC